MRLFPFILNIRSEAFFTDDQWKSLWEESLTTKPYYNNGWWSEIFYRFTPQIDILCLHSTTNLLTVGLIIFFELNDTGVIITNLCNLHWFDDKYYHHQSLNYFGDLTNRNHLLQFPYYQKYYP